MATAALETVYEPKPYNDEQVDTLRISMAIALGHLRHCWKTGHLDAHDAGLVSRAIKELEKHTSAADES